MSRMGSSKADRRARRQLTDEFKAGAVRLVLDEVRTVAAVVRGTGAAQLVGDEPTRCLSLDPQASPKASPRGELT
jgi:hypothetical protein